MRQRDVILVIGVPRSGSTWLANTLTSSSNVDLVMEPDNEKISVLASVFKQKTPRFPTLRMNEAGDPALKALWQCAFQSDWAPMLSRSFFSHGICWLRSASKEEAISAKGIHLYPALKISLLQRMMYFLCRMPGTAHVSNRLIKSVHAVLYPEWIVRHCKPSWVIISMRHPLAVLQSWRRLKMPDACRLFAGNEYQANGQCELKYMSRQLAAMYAALDEAIDRNPDWIVVWHEVLCRDPVGQFRDLAERCGVVWTQAMSDYVTSMNKDGQGYKTQRNASQEIGKWKKTISDEEHQFVHQAFDEVGLIKYVDVDV